MIVIVGRFVLPLTDHTVAGEAVCFY
jgi:hypothetical protein